MAAARTVIFAQMVDDPSDCPEEFPTTKGQDQERERLFRLIEDLVPWKNTTNEAVLQRARDEIRRSWWRTCGTTQTIQGQPSYSTPASGRHFTIHLLAVGRCRWKPNGNYQVESRAAVDRTEVATRVPINDYQRYRHRFPPARRWGATPSAPYRALGRLRMLLLSDRQFA